MQHKITYIKIADLEPSSLNPRKNIVQSELEALAQSIREHGILQPLTVRKSGKSFEIICGERRFCSARIAELESVPAIIQELTDDEARQVMLIENIQRQDIHPMEEALTLQDLKAQGLTIDQLSTKLGKSTIYIQKRMKLLELIPAAQKQFASGEIEYSQAIQIARLQEDDQKKVLEHATTGYGKDKRLLDSRKLAEYIQSDIMLKFKDAIFKLDDALLVPAAGACDTCPKRTRNRPELFDTAEKEDKCVDSACFKLKTSTFMENKKAELKAKHGEISTGTMHRWNDTVTVKGQAMKVLKKKEEGAIPVLITSGDKKGKTVFAIKPAPEVKGKSTGTESNKKASEEKKKADKKIRNAFRRALFLELYAAITNGKQLPDPAVKVARELLYEGDCTYLMNTPESIGVAAGYLVPTEGKDWSEIKYKQNDLETKLIAFCDKLSIERCILLFSVAADVEEANWGEQKIDSDREMMKVCVAFEIDWAAKWKAFQADNAPKPVEKKVAPAAKKIASGAKKVASKAIGFKITEVEPYPVTSKKGKGLKALLTDADA